jgi:hypothetical protein
MKNGADSTTPIFKTEGGAGGVVSDGFSFAPLAPDETRSKSATVSNRGAIPSS